MQRDLFNNLKTSRAISCQQVSDNTAQVGQIIDNQGFDALLYVIDIGTLADADATFAVLLEHGDDPALSDAAAVPDVMLLGTEALAGFDFADDNTVNKLGYLGDKRYTRITITPAANTSAADFGCVAVQGKAHAAPV